MKNLFWEKPQVKFWWHEKLRLKRPLIHHRNKIWSESHPNPLTILTLPPTHIPKRFSFTPQTPFPFIYGFSPLTLFNSLWTSPFFPISSNNQKIQHKNLSYCPFLFIISFFLPFCSLFLSRTIVYHLNVYSKFSLYSLISPLSLLLKLFTTKTTLFEFFSCSIFLFE